VHGAGSAEDGTPPPLRRKVKRTNLSSGSHFPEQGSAQTSRRSKVPSYGKPEPSPCLPPRVSSKGSRPTRPQREVPPCLARSSVLTCPAQCREQTEPGGKGAGLPTGKGGEGRVTRGRQQAGRNLLGRHARPAAPCHPVMRWCAILTHHLAFRALVVKDIVPNQANLGQADLRGCRLSPVLQLMRVFVETTAAEGTRSPRAYA